MAFSQPPWTLRSACRSPSRLSVRTRTGPSTGSLKMPVVTGCPFQLTSRGRPTLTDRTLTSSSPCASHSPVALERDEPTVDGAVLVHDRRKLLRRARGNDCSPAGGEHGIDEMAADVACAAGHEDPFVGESRHWCLRHRWASHTTLRTAPLSPLRAG